MEGDQNESPSMEFAGTENDLNHILSTFVDSEDEINNFSTSNYVAMADIQSIFQTGQSDFVIATLNIQSINAKFDNLYAIMNNLSASGQYFGAVCLQETWLTSDADVTLFDIPGYKLIHQGSRCTRHGGLIIYLHEKYCYEVRNLYSSSDIWEGLFIDVTGHNLRKRPISPLSSLSKVFEKIVFDQLYDYLITNGLLFESQYGFRKQHSTELAALELTDRIRREMDQNRIPFSVFLDLSKAFDTLNHHILLSKLKYYGIRSTALQWFKSYLTERQQFVEYQNVCSSTRELETGVPQGSVFGPLLFLIYVNDIHTVSNKLNFILYADDTTLTSPLCSFTHGAQNDVSHVSSQINSELLNIFDWLKVNKLSLNVDKTKYMIFTIIKGW